MEKSSRLKTALKVALPAPMYWHTRHQHNRVVSGASGVR